MNSKKHKYQYEKNARNMSKENEKVNNFEKKNKKTTDNCIKRQLRNLIFV